MARKKTDEDKKLLELILSKCLDEDEYFQLSENVDIEQHDTEKGTLIFQAMLHDNPIAFIWLMNRNCRINDVQDEKGRYPLHLAAQIGERSWLEMLLASGADIYLTDHKGNTPYKLYTERYYRNVDSMTYDEYAEFDEMVLKLIPVQKEKKDK